MKPSRLVLVAVLLMVLGGCSDDSESATSSTASSASSAVSETSAVTTSTIEAAPATTDAVSTSAAPASAAPTTVVATTAAVPPAVTDPEVVPAPPNDECPLVPADQSSAEIAITDDAVQYLGAIAPPCLRVYDNQFIVLMNNSEADATVDIGRDSLEIIAGDQVDSQPVGAYAAAGAVVDAYVSELDIAIAIQVIPAQ